jgi:hypothetical protein
MTTATRTRTAQPPSIADLEAEAARLVQEKDAARAEVERLEGAPVAERKAARDRLHDLVEQVRHAQAAAVRARQGEQHEARRSALDGFIEEAGGRPDVAVRDTWAAPIEEARDALAEVEAEGATLDHQLQTAAEAGDVDAMVRLRQQRSELPARVIAAKVRLARLQADEARAAAESLRPVAARLGEAWQEAVEVADRAAEERNLRQAARDSVRGTMQQHVDRARHRDQEAAALTAQLAGAVR